MTYAQDSLSLLGHKESTLQGHGLPDVCSVYLYTQANARVWSYLPINRRKDGAPCSPTASLTNL